MDAIAKKRRNSYLITDLPIELYLRIISYLPTEKAAATSLITKKWRDKFPLTSRLSFYYENVFDDDANKNSFMAFIDRVFAVRGNTPLRKLSIMVLNCIDGNRVDKWIRYALQRGVSNLTLDILEVDGGWGPRELFDCDSLVKMKLGSGNSGLIVDKEYIVRLPNLKFLHIEDVQFQDGLVGFTKLLTGCSALEDLTVTDMLTSYEWESVSFYHKSIKNFKYGWKSYDEDERTGFPLSVSFDTPELLILDYEDYIAQSYPSLRFDKLVGATVCLQRVMRDVEQEYEEEEEEDENEEGIEVEENDCAPFMRGISHIVELRLRPETIEVLAFCCSAMPQFINLKILDFLSKPNVGWESLPSIIRSSPNIDTLTFRGFFHKATDSCGDVCLCNDLRVTPSCLSTSPVKVLEIYERKQANKDPDFFIKQMTHLLRTMPNIEDVIIYCHDSSHMVALSQMSSDLDMIPDKASPLCEKIQVVLDNNAERII